MRRRRPPRWEMKATRQALDLPLVDFVLAIYRQHMGDPWLPYVVSCRFCFCTLCYLLAPLRFVSLRDAYAS